MKTRITKKLVLETAGSLYSCIQDRVPMTMIIKEVMDKTGNTRWMEVSDKVREILRKEGWTIKQMKGAN